MKLIPTILALVIAVLPLAAFAQKAEGKSDQRKAATTGPDIKWKAPTRCLGGGAFNVHLELTAPAGGTVVAGWLLTPSAFTVDGKPLAEREEKGSMTLPEGAKVVLDLDLGPYLKVEKDFELGFAKGIGDDKPAKIVMMNPASAGLNFMDEKSVPTDDLKKYNVLLQTNRGDMIVEFWPEAAPMHVRNFLDLSYTNFYSGTTFHRIIPGFMIQGGDPTASGAGNGPRTLKAEFNDRKHERGVLSMARQGDQRFARNPTQDPLKDTASCQFFVMHAANPGLDGGYSAFGRLIAGYETLDAIAATPRDASDKPNEVQKILKATVVLAAPAAK
ncbi:MAG TPA: peptidylprolyl isomerase [Planctomycetota bacterium]|nr:peptidylprolyl isomerase [Planctomycetota bacterium]